MDQIDYAGAYFEHRDLIADPPIVTEMRVIVGTQEGAGVEPKITSLLVITVDGKEIFRVPASAIPSDIIEKLKLVAGWRHVTPPISP